MSRAYFIGGPKHGQVIDVPNGHDIITFPERERLSYQAYKSADPYSYAFKTVNCEVFKLRLAPGRDITGIRHPEVKEDTARMYLADLVITSWEKTVADTSHRF